MNIELSEQTERAVRSVVQSGKFGTAEAFLEAAAKAFLAEVGEYASEPQPDAEELKARFKPFRGKLKMTRDEVIKARHHGLS